MSFIAALDISTFIWCKDDYEKNKEDYYPLLSIFPKVFDQIYKFRLPILMRNELYDIIAADFPYIFLSKIGYSYYSTKILRLLTTSEWCTYEQAKEIDFQTIPEVIKSYFNQKLIEESNNQIVHMYNNASENKFIAYNHFFKSETNLILNGQEKVIIDTLKYSSESEIIEFFEKFKIRFEHNPKHRREAYYDYERKEDVSPFSCYHIQGETKAQELLDGAILFKGIFYNYDLENSVFVRFIKTREFTFHGHDLSDVGNNIPNEIKKKFSK